MLMQSKKLFGTGLVAILAMLVTIDVWAHCGGNHTGNHPHCQGQGGGGEDPIFTAESLDPNIPAVDSYDVFQETTIVFRDAQFDLSQFEGTWDNSGGACDHGFTGGTFTIKPKSDSTPDLALLTATFQSELETGQVKTHVFTMEGLFDEPGNWPPSSGDPQTTITFDYWEVQAENKKAQRDDCAGESATVPDPNGPWTVAVTRQP
jgi:hypothetical protein